MKTRTVVVVAWAFGVIGLSAIVGADALVLRDGRRLQGTLVGVQSGVVEFAEQRMFRSSRLVRFDRDEVQRIDLDEDSGPRSFGADEGAGGVAARPSGLREREVIVSGDVPWNDSGVEVRAGQAVYFSAVGRVRWGPGRRDSPAGEANSPYNPNRPIPRRPAAGLIAKVGHDSTDYFFIGDEQGAIRMRSSGRLYLGINDDVLSDNSGNFRVVVAY